MTAVTTAPAISEHVRFDPGAGLPARRPVALVPEDLSRFFVQRANAGDVDGLVALYEPDAVLALPTGEVVVGRARIRAAYEQILRGRPRFAAGEQQSALVSGDLALTSTHLPAGATAEVARRQPDGTWLWMVDQPNVKG